MSNSAISGLTIIDFPAGMIMPYAGTSTPAGWLECNGAEVDVSAYPTLAAALGTTWNNAKNPLTGATYANPAAGRFRLPDLRGSFLRGSSGGANNAQGVATGLAEFQGNKTAKNGLTATAASVTTSVSGLKNQLNGSSGGMSANTTHGHGISDPGHGHAHGIDTTQGYAVGTPISATSGATGFQGGTFSDRGATTTGSGFVRNGGTGISVNGSADLNHSHSWDFGGSATFSASGTTPAQTVSVGNGDAETRPDAVGVRYLIKI
jgi:microcystin-dependent protein